MTQWIISAIAVAPMAFLMAYLFDVSEWEFWALIGAAFWWRIWGTVGDYFARVRLKTGGEG